MAGLYDTLKGIITRIKARHYTKTESDNKYQSKLTIANASTVDSTSNTQVPTSAAVQKMIEAYIKTNGGVSSGTTNLPSSNATGDTVTASYYGYEPEDNSVVENYYGNGEE